MEPPGATSDTHCGDRRPHSAKRRARQVFGACIRILYRCSLWQSWQPVSPLGDGWRGQVALFSTLAVVGLPVWLFHWAVGPRRDRDAASLARRLYVYLSLIGAMLTLIGSIAAALYRLIGLGLGDSSNVSVLTDLAHALAVAAVAAVVAVYHWRVLRADAPAAVAENGPAESRAIVELRAADPAALERALAALQASGVEVKIVR